MRKIIGFLFPWRQMYRRLELGKRWWHRLAVVVFFVALLPTFLYSWVFGDDANGPVHSYMGEIQDWAILPPPPVGYVSVRTVIPATAPPDANSIEKGMIAMPLGAAPITPDARLEANYILETIEMPDGTTATYQGTTSDETIKAEWQHRLNVAQAKAALVGFGIAVLVTAIFSYLLQAVYRMVLYIIYGARAGSTSNRLPL